MKRHLPLIVVGLAILLLVAGLAYDVMFAGIPYQDPTPEMSARYAFHSRIASVFYVLGGVTFLIGAASGILRLAARRLSSPQAS